MPLAWFSGAEYQPLEIERLGIRNGDFVFYSVFEWQDRKNPKGLMQAFLQAFPEHSDALLLIKTNPGAVTAARQTLEEVRDATGSCGRIALWCEAWTDAQLHGLHHRGDCYVSLHKGEGWGYPLFEAACRGKPVVATAFAGPADYLDPEHHWLVRHTSTPVQQAYAYYQPSMRWAEPDLAHAAAGMRHVYEHRDRVRTRAQQAADALKTTYSLEAIGATAKGRSDGPAQTYAPGEVGSTRLAGAHSASNSRLAHTG